MNRVVVAKVNADAHSSLGSKYGVQGKVVLPRGQVLREWLSDLARAAHKKLHNKQVVYK